MDTRAAKECENCLYSKNHLGTNEEVKALRKVLSITKQPFHCHEYGPWKLGEHKPGVVCASYAAINNLCLEIEKSSPANQRRFKQMSNEEKFFGKIPLF